MDKKEEDFKNQVTSQQKNVSKFRNSMSFNSLSNHQFGIIDNNNEKYGYDLDNSSSNSKSSSNSNAKSDTVNYNLVSDPYIELLSVKNVIIKIEYQNCCCINVNNNLYNVFTKNKSNIKYLFRTKELMPCTDYSCCEYIAKPFSLSLDHVISMGEDINTRQFATAQKSCTIPCFCFCRPEFEVKMSDNNKTSIGKITLPYSCGDTEYKIYTGTNQLKYIIDTECCQYGIICPKNCCGYFPEVFFDIFNDKYQKDGTIERKPGEFKEFMHVLDCYQIYFPKDSTIEDKILLICAVFMIEHEIFRDKWGSLEYCTDSGCSCTCNEDCCLDCGYRFCAEFCSSFFRF